MSSVRDTNDSEADLTSKRSASNSASAAASAASAADNVDNAVPTKPNARPRRAAQKRERHALADRTNAAPEQQPTASKRAKTAVAARPATRRSTRSRKPSQAAQEAEASAAAAVASEAPEPAVPAAAVAQEASTAATTTATADDPVTVQDSTTATAATTAATTVLPSAGAGAGAASASSAPASTSASASASASAPEALAPIATTAAAAGVVEPSSASVPAGDVDADKVAMVEKIVASGFSPEDINNIDAESGTNVRFFVDYITEVFSYLRELEVAHHVSSTYMKDVQTDINAAMRAILVDWLVEVAEEYRLLPETLYICVAYIDRCLSAFNVSRSKLQLLGCSCMLLAAKYEEIYAPAVDEFVYISDNTYTREEILKMESSVLSHMGFRLSVATPKQFIRRFLKAAGASQQEVVLTAYLAELTLQEYEFVKFRASHLAAAAVLCARLLLRRENSWTPTLEFYSGYSCLDLQDCVLSIARVHMNAPRNNLQAVREKYSHPSFLRVAVSVPCADSLDDMKTNLAYAESHVAAYRTRNMNKSPVDSETTAALGADVDHPEPGSPQ